MLFLMLFSIAIGHGTQILIGHMMGAGQIEVAYKRGVKSLKIAFVISTLAAILFYFAGSTLLEFFTDDITIIEMGMTLLLVTIILEPGRAFNLVLINSLRAAGDVQFPVVAGIISMWGISVTFAWFFGIYLGLGLLGVWIGYIANEWIRGILMWQRWKSRVWTGNVFIRDEQN
ncbi:MATE family efflux transporter [Gracilibacillus caseinilyticus]|uniref:MATE family efflux transporter n=1 Tax=Gracilibacillus caseinilyticus TaxID=2932256 RepID=A0ABY4ESQ8_9BACI|nr:MATE family efflux transporter [Gracilibacillus caseinilyticus]UOQ46902.1 MATE family efflux transporter [Gracilibacillus caseinilyticus]